MSASVEYQMTEIYCVVDDFLKGHPRLAQRQRSPHVSEKPTGSHEDPCRFQEELEGSDQETTPHGNLYRVV